MRTVFPFGKHLFRLAVLLILVTPGCYALRNMAGGMKSVRILAPQDQLLELTLIVAKGESEIVISEYANYDSAVKLVEPPLLDGWLNFYQFIPPVDSGGSWSLQETPGQNRYVHLDDEAIEAQAGDLDVAVRFERWNLQHDDEEAQVILIAWFEGDGVALYQMKASEIREHSGEIRVAMSGITSQARAPK